MVCLKNQEREGEEEEEEEEEEEVGKEGKEKKLVLAVALNGFARFPHSSFFMNS